jgi:hypothetical protein
MEEMSEKEKNIITCHGNEELQSVNGSSSETKYLFKMSQTYLLFSDLVELPTKNS